MGKKGDFVTRRIFDNKTGRDSQAAPPVAYIVLLRIALHRETIRVFFDGEENGAFQRSIVRSMQN